MGDQPPTPDHQSGSADENEPNMNYPSPLHGVSPSVKQMDDNEEGSMSDDSNGESCEREGHGRRKKMKMKYQTLGSQVRKEEDEMARHKARDVLPKNLLLSPSLGSKSRKKMYAQLDEDNGLPMGDGPPGGELTDVLDMENQVVSRVRVNDELQAAPIRWKVQRFCTVILLVFCIVVVMLLFGALIQILSNAVNGIFVGSPQAADGLAQSDDGVSVSSSEGSVSGVNGAVASDNEQCSEIGIDQLRNGGNAVDAAIASTLCLGVLQPFASGIGGGAFIMIRLSNGTAVFLDAREYAFSAAHRDMYKSNPSESVLGPNSAAVPGEVMGLYRAWQMYGSLPWKSLVEPSIALAQSHTMHALLYERAVTSQEEIKADPGLRSIYAPDGNIIELDGKVSNPALADTLTHVANSGSSGFYDGVVLEGLASDIASAGGNMTKEDIAGYNIRVRAPLRSFYKGLELFTAPPSSSGGAVEAMVLNILERYQLTKDNYDWHYVVEAFKHGYAHRMQLGDDYFVNVTNLVQGMVSKERAALIRGKIEPDKTFDPSYYTDDLLDFPIDDGTSHLSVLDKAGNAVSVTSTVNTGFASKFLSPSTGILLNNEMDDFSTPGASNFFDLPPSESNFIEPFKKPLSSMSPTIITKDNRPYLVVGGSGGPRIITSTLLVDLGYSIEQAVNEERFHHQLIPNQVTYEAGLSDSVLDSLRARGHKLVEADHLGVTQVVKVDDDGTMHAQSDPRKKGKAAAF